MGAGIKSKMFCQSSFFSQAVRTINSSSALQIIHKLRSWDDIFVLFSILKIQLELARTGGQTPWVNRVYDYECFRWAAAGRRNILRASRVRACQFTAPQTACCWFVLILRHRGHQLPVLCSSNTGWHLQHHLTPFTAHLLPLCLYYVRWTTLIHQMTVL